VVGPFAARHSARTRLSDRLSQRRFNDDLRTPRTEDLLRYDAARLGNRVDTVARNPKHINSFAAPFQFVKLGGA
jgi:hypothetical protein